MRISLGIEYDGSQFYGWQRQCHAASVQQAVEEAVSSVADAPVRVYAAGRTDTGVHAMEQVAHFDSPTERDVKAWTTGVNMYLPDSVSVLWARPVDEDFHARNSARARRYRYIILNRGTRPALLNRRVTWVFQSLNQATMQEAANYLQGTHDFSSYRALSCQAKSPVRSVHEINVIRQGEFVYIDVYADGFLHHMVRNMAGVLITIGKGERDASWAQKVLRHRDRTLGGVTAQADGLYLVKVQYDTEYGFDAAIRWPVFTAKLTGCPHADAR